MEIIEEETTDPHENEPAIVDIKDDKIKLLEKRGFFPTSDGLIDDTYYAIKKDLTKSTSLRQYRSVKDLIELPYEDMERVLFMKDSMIAIEVCFFYGDARLLSSFNGQKRFYDVDPLYLEPFIARYVRAINRCGMETFYSCDGWHKRPDKSQELVILFRDRYSWIWHMVLCEYNNIDGLCHWEHTIDGSMYLSRIQLPKDDKDKKQIYSRVLAAADEFLNKCNILKELKNSFLSAGYPSRIDSFSDSEVEEIIRVFFADQFVKTR